MQLVEVEGVFTHIAACFQIPSDRLPMPRHSRRTQRDVHRCDDSNRGLEDGARPNARSSSQSSGKGGGVVCYCHSLSDAFDSRLLLPIICAYG